MMIYGILLLLLVGMVWLLGRQVTEMTHASRCAHYSETTTLANQCQDQNLSAEQVHLPPVSPVTLDIRVHDEVRLMG